MTQAVARKSLTSDIVLGLFDGVDNALWCYGFATILFAGALSSFLPLGITIILTGWALLGLYIAATSASLVHMTSIDEQAVVILASTATLMTTTMGPEASGPRGLATMLALMSITALSVAAAFVLVGRFRLTRLLELLPYPVICGFMAGVGWLLLDAAVFVTVDEHVTSRLPSQLASSGNAWKLLITAICGLGLTLFVRRINRAWALPAASLFLLGGFYLITAINGISRESLIENGWLFDISSNTGGALSFLRSLSFSDVDGGFLFSALPQVLTVVFLALLSASMSLTAMAAASRFPLETSGEMRKQGAGNLLCALVFSPPGYTDVASSVLYEEMGASSRWMPLASNAVCLLVALAGTWMIGYMPKVLVAATIFFFAFAMLYEWLYENVRGFQAVDFAIVIIILAMVIFVDFTVGVLTGIVLTVLLFVMRYSMISAIQGRYSLSDFRSSVERPSSANRELDQHGGEALIYTLRGFLFFGTANAILDRIKADLAASDVQRDCVLLDFKRVTGIDISALNTFVQVRNNCEDAGAKLFYSGVRPEMMDKIIAMDAASVVDNKPMLFTDLDYALEYMEEQVLHASTPTGRQLSVREQLERILPEREKIDLLIGAMERVECETHQVLFTQGESDTGFYILESGTMSAYIEAMGSERRRVKKFGPGSLIGEMSAYTQDRKRTATLVADQASVLYHMPRERLEYLDQQDSQLAAAIHELIARTLGSRMSYMNRRLLVELES